MKAEPGLGQRQFIVLPIESLTPVLGEVGPNDCSFRTDDECRWPGTGPCQGRVLQSPGSDESHLWVSEINNSASIESFAEGNLVPRIGGNSDDRSSRLSYLLPYGSEPSELPRAKRSPIAPIKDQQDRSTAQRWLIEIPRATFGGRDDELRNHVSGLRCALGAREAA